MNPPRWANRTRGTWEASCASCGSSLDGEAVRISYWLAPDCRIVLLTVFRKTKMRETAEIERAMQAQKVCEAEHSPAEHIYDRTREAQ
jgi:hypothetical protein